MTPTTPSLPTRRSFLKTGGNILAASALVSSRLFGADSVTPTRLRKAVMVGTLRFDGSIGDKFKAIRDAGFHGVEAMSHMNVEEVLRAREETGLEIPSVCCSTHWKKPLSSPDPAVRAEGLDGLRQSLREAHRYGASSVLLVPAVVNSEVSYAEAWERSIAEIRKALPLAAELKVRIAIENVWNHFLLSPLEAAGYIDGFNSPWIGWHFDAGNILNYGWPEQWVRVLGPRIVQVHVKGFSRKKRNEQGLWKGFDVGLLEGDIDWPALWRALAESGYGGWVITEQGVGSVDALGQLGRDLDQALATT